MGGGNTQEIHTHTDIQQRERQSEMGKKKETHRGKDWASSDIMAQLRPDSLTGLLLAQLAL